MLLALPITLWLHLNAILGKQAKKASTTSIELQSVQQQPMKSPEAYSQVRRNMY